VTTPFAPYANLTVVFDVPTSSTVGQDGVSNIATTQRVIIASVRAQSTSLKRTEQIADGNEDAISLTGNWVNPSGAIRTLLSQQKGVAVLWDLTAGFSLPTSTGFASISAYDQFLTENGANIAQRGDVLYLPSVPSPYGDEQVIGSKFQAIVVARSAWGNAV
jgi:hypothetical protein